MFKLEDWAGNPLDDDYAKQRLRNEPIVEITQIKGTSETHPVLSTRDEWAGFEIMPYRVGAYALSKLEGSYVRDALLNGLALEQAGMTTLISSVLSAQAIRIPVRVKSTSKTSVQSWVCCQARLNREVRCREPGSRQRLATRL